MAARSKPRARHWRRAPLALALATLALAVGGCARGPKRPRLVLLYAPCTVNTSLLSPYSSAVKYTPNLSAFSAGALTLERHQTESAQSGLAYAALFTGTHAMRHGVYCHPTRLPDGPELITQAFARGGWSVHTWLVHPMANASLGYARGTPAENVHRLLLADQPDFVRLLDRLVQHPDEHALAIANFSVTHAPYKGKGLERLCADHPEECGARADSARFRQLADAYAQDHLGFSYDFDRTVAKHGYTPQDVAQLAAVLELLYKADLVFLDDLFGQVLAALTTRGLLDDSVVVFTADHGEVLYRDNALFRWAHGFQLAPEELSVPLVVRGPGAGIRPGRYPAVTRAIDVFPTLLALAGLPVPASVSGRDLSRAWRGQEPAPDLVAFSHTALFAPPAWERYRAYPAITAQFPDLDPDLIWVTARRGDRVFVLRRFGEAGFQPRLFDLATDPEQRHDLFDPRDAEHRRMLRELEQYKASLVAGFRAPPQPGELPGPSRAEQEERLRALGYIK